MYSPQVLDHFQEPRNVGELAAPDARVRVENPACGDILELTVKIENGVIAAVRFRAKGCVSAVACGSLLTEMIAGKHLIKAGELHQKDLIRKIGGLPPASGHAAQLAMDALHALLVDATRGK
jgi:nitrogen fixation protein NifU and related proteins